MNESDSQAELWDVLAELSRRYPEWRVGQLVANVAEWSDQGIWDVDDDEMLRVAHRHLAQAKKPLADPISA